MIDNLADRIFWKALNYPRKCFLVQHLRIAHDQKADNFESQLIKLLHKADNLNGTKLRLSYPELTALVNAWQTEQINFVGSWVFRGWINQEG